MKQRTLEEIAEFFGCKAERQDGFIFNNMAVLYEDEKGYNEGRFMSLVDSGNFIKEDDHDTSNN